MTFDIFKFVYPGTRSSFTNAGNNLSKKHFNEAAFVKELKNPLKAAPY